MSEMLPAPPPSLPRAKVNRFAVASLTLSLFSLLCGCLTAIPAVVLGIVALRRIEASAGAETGRGHAIAGIAVGAGITLLMLVTMPLQLVAILGPAYERYLEGEDRAVCQSNMRKLYESIERYRVEHEGAYPESLEALFPDYAKDLNVFTCPSDRYAAEEQGSTIDEWSSYEYAAPDPGSDESGEKMVRDKEPWHMPGGRNVLYTDGNVQFVRERASAEKRE